MARKITGITIDNYRAWYGPYETIHLPNGENLLIYGENGSGKSSFFKALQNFFRSSLKHEPAFEFNRIAATQGITGGSVQIEFTDISDNASPPTTFIYSTADASTNQIDFLRNTRKLYSFLDYKNMLGIHYYDVESTNTPDLFKLIVIDLLGEFSFPETQQKIADEFIKLKKDISKRSNSRDYSAAVIELPRFKQRLTTKLGEVRLETNRLLATYFKNGVDIVISDFVCDQEGKKIRTALKFAANYYEEAFPNYNYTLNEARLSAVAICFYLASIKSHPAEAAEYKILFLDDIFIGLDTSNRIPLLEIIRNEFQDFQIFLSTYDRNWFELAKEQLRSSQWRLLEMYYEPVKRNDPALGEVTIAEKPIFIKSSFSFLEKAEKYFRTKDYPACSNYLRKEVERILRSLLPLERRVNQDENFGTRDETKLENLLNSFTAYTDECNITLPQRTLEAIRLYRKVVLNPQSHNDIHSPVFRVELEKAFSAIDELSSIPKISRTSVATIGGRFVYRNHANHGYLMELELADNIYKVEFGGNTTISKFKFRIVDWHWNGTQYATRLTGSPMTGPKLEEFCIEKRTLQEVFQIITHGGINPTPANLEQAISLAGQTLHQLLI
jgi:energy-coupling factor transporter ATP-binding protein EcfA2